jgi:hypothetical protein
MRARLTRVSVAAATATLVAGTTVSVVAAAPAAKAGGCGGQVWAPPAGGENEDRGGAMIWGAPGVRVTYKWEVQGDIGKVNVSVMGYDEKTNLETWYYAGLWDSGSHGKAVAPWGHHASVPRIRVKTPPGPFPGVMVDWSC